VNVVNANPQLEIYAVHTLSPYSAPSLFGTVQAADANELYSFPFQLCNDAGNCRRSSSTIS
jgi:hypothetical protein